MSLINSTAIPSSGGYEIEQSLRFEDGSSAYLERTPSSAGNRKTYTFSCWTKRGNIGVANSLFSAYPAASPSDANVVQFGFTSDDKFQCGFQNFYVVQTTRVFRDASAWYNIVVRIDTTQSTATNRFKVWINGVEETSFSTDGRASISVNQDTGINMSGNPHRVGTLLSNNWDYDGYMGEVNFIDGLAKAPADFGETGDYGEWKPIEYSGSYGTNGFYLPFKQDYTVEGFSTVTFTGNGASTQYVGGVGFQPDFVWLKKRSATQNHNLFDSIRGVTKGIKSNLAAKEETDSSFFTAFNTDGFSLGSGGIWN